MSPYVVDSSAPSDTAGFQVPIIKYLPIIVVFILENMIEVFVRIAIGWRQ